jgi:L-asparaginase
MTISIITTGGTFDKVYFDALSEFRFGEPIVGDLLAEANVDFEYHIEPLMQKDSLDMDDADRDRILQSVSNSENRRILIIHGTDGMVATARHLLEIEDRTIVLFGAMQPARMRYSDAMYNLGFACAAVQLLPAGVHLAMNGRIFDPRSVSKNRSQGRFESREGE